MSVGGTFVVTERPPGRGAEFPALTPRFGDVLGRGAAGSGNGTLPAAVVRPLRGVDGGAITGNCAASAGLNRLRDALARETEPNVRTVLVAIGCAAQDTSRARGPAAGHARHEVRVCVGASFGGPAIPVAWGARAAGRS